MAQVPESFMAMLKAFLDIDPKEEASVPEPDMEEYSRPIAVLPDQDTQESKDQ